MNGFGFIRLTLALLVVDHHIGLVIPRLNDYFKTLPFSQDFAYLGVGHIAVYGFFVITGFMIAFVWNDQYRHYDQGRKAFWLSRMLRIYPLHVIVLLAFLAALALLTDAELPSPAKILLNLVLIPQAVAGFVVDFNHLAYSTINLPTWTLAYDLLFYLIAPFIVGSRRRLWLILGIELAFVAVLSVQLPNDFKTWHMYYFTTGHSLLLAFVAGALVYHYQGYLRGKYRFVPAALGIAWLSVYPVGLTHYLLGIVVTIALFVVIAGNATLFGKRDMLLGDMTYPIYLVHYPLLQLLVDQSPGLIPWPFKGISVAVSTLLLSVALLFLVEEPLKAWRKRVTRFVVERTTRFDVAVPAPLARAAVLYVFPGVLVLTGLLSFIVVMRGTAA